MSRRDDDALSWGDDDPTLDTGTSARGDDSRDEGTDASARVLPTGFTAVGRGSEALREAPPGVADGGPRDAAADDSTEDAAGLSNVGLLALGVLGGVYLLFAIGWLIAGLRLQPAAAFLVSSQGVAPPLWMGGNLVAVWLAVLAGPIWFATVYLLTARSRAWLRWLLLVIGALLLVPWPFVMVGTVGS